MTKLKKITCKTCGVDFEIENYKSRTYCSRSCKNKDPELVSKSNAVRKQTWDDKYGGHPMALTEVQNRFKETIQKKYGVSHALQSKELLQQAQNTKLERYGDAHFANRDKAIETKLLKYGSSNNHQKRTLNTLNRRFQIYSNIRLVNPEEFSEITGNRFTVECLNCGRVWKCGLMNNYHPQCKQCSKKYIKTSKGHSEILTFLQESLPGVEILSNSRILNPKFELDIFIPSLNLAVEFNGLYFHNDQLKDKKYHLKKTRVCTSHGVQLLHIFEHEWLHKKEIVKSMLLSKIQKLTSSIYARQCVIVPLSSKEKKAFFDTNHLHGDVRSSKCFGLSYQGTIVCALSMGKPRFSNHFEWEVIRFANIKYANVVGGFSKLLKYFIKTFDPVSILTFADRSWSTGSVYIKNGFTFLEFTPPNYFYFKNTTAYPRQMFQKHKLEELLPKFSPDLSEYENMLNNGYLRVWNSGNVKLVWWKNAKKKGAM
jgi:hypothetical protein